MTVVDSQHGLPQRQPGPDGQPVLTTAVTTINALQADGPSGVDAGPGKDSGERLSGGRIAEQAFVMAFNDTFLITAIVLCWGCCRC